MITMHDNFRVAPTAGWALPRRQSAEDYVDAGLELAIQVWRENQLLRRRGARVITVEQRNLRRLSLRKARERFQLPQAKPANVQVAGVIRADLRFGAETRIG